MDACKSKQGFFTLRGCGEMSVRNCDVCARPMCSRHLSASTSFTRCLDCVARGAEKTALQQPPAKPGAPLVYRPPAHPDDWAYEQRHRYYRSHHYAPFYFGDGDDGSYYDDYDLRSFDRDLGSGSSMSLTDDAGDPAGKADWGDS